MSDDSGPKKILVGYEELGGVRMKVWRYENLRPRAIVRTVDLFREPNWEVRREGQRFLFEFQAARHGGGTDVHEITEAEFESVKTGALCYEDLLRKYDR